jgi:hypothetical protein
LRAQLSSRHQYVEDSNNLEAKAVNLLLHYCGCRSLWGKFN